MAYPDERQTADFWGEKTSFERSLGHKNEDSAACSGAVAADNGIGLCIFCMRGCTHHEIGYDRHNFIMTSAAAC